MSNIQYFADGEQATAAVLNRPLKDLEKSGQYMSKAQFRNNQLKNKEHYAGNGFIEWGSTEGYGTINSGLWAYNGSLRMGRNYKSRMNINGWNILIDKINDASWPIIKFDESTTPVIEDNFVTSVDYKQGDFGVLTNTSNEFFPDPSFAGDEVIFNNNGSSYTTHVDLSIVDGTLNATTKDSSNTYADVAWSFPSSKVSYTVSFDIVSVGGVGIKLYQTGINQYLTDFLEVGSYTFELSPGTTGIDFVCFASSAEAEETFVFDNISVKMTKQKAFVVENAIPSGTNILTSNDVIMRDYISRQDLVFIEAWEENISEKDFVYPLGNTQYGNGNNVNGLSGITEGSFIGADTYSLFGDWQEDTTIIGKGYIWSELSTTQQLSFAEDTNNNIFKTKDGIMQVRYRVRVIKGQGNNWDGIDPNDSSYLAYRWSYGHTRVNIKGKAIKVNDYSGNDYNTYRRTSSYRGVFTASHGVHIEKTFAYPIALVQHRNTGAYHPTFNPDGTSQFSDDMNWFETSNDSNSIRSCFLNASDTGISGREDKLTTKISVRDVLDLRMDSNRIQDKKSLITEENKKLMQGNARGFEKSTVKYERVAQLEVISYGVYKLLKTSEYQKSDGSINNSKCDINNLPTYFIGNNDVYCEAINDTDNSQRHHIHLNYTSNGSAKNEIGSTGSVHIYGSYKGTAVNDIGPAGTIIDVYAPIKKGYISNGTVSTCDIIGKPNNLPESMKENGFTGNLNINLYDGLQDISLQKTGTGAYDLYLSKMSYKYSSSYIKPTRVVAYDKELDSYFDIPFVLNYDIVTSDDKGMYGVYASSFIHVSPYDDGTWNDELVFFVYYDARAYFLDSNINRTSVETHDDIICSNYSSYSYGGSITENLLKVPCKGGSTAGDTVPGFKGKTAHNNFQTNTHNIVYHEEFKNLRNQDVPTAKFIPYLHEYKGRAKLNYIFKEMKLDNNYNYETIITVQSTDTLDIIKGNLYKVSYNQSITIDGGTYNVVDAKVTIDDDGVEETYDVVDGTVTIGSTVINCVGPSFIIQANTTSTNSNTYGQYVIQNGLVYTADGLLTSYFKVWDGNSWGDNSILDVDDKINYKTDDNGNKVMIGQKVIKLNKYID